MFTGEITLGVLAQHYEKLLSDPEAEQILTWVTDMRGCTLNVRGDDIKDLVRQHIEPLMQGRKWHCAAIVGTAVQYGATNQFAVYSAECGHTRVFYDQKEAMEWAAELVAVER
jgi:hypothetical protein